MGYSYDYYSQICFLLRDKGFYPKNILDIGASVCQTADIMRQIWPVANILLFEGNAECEKLYQKQLYDYQIKLLGKINGTTKFYKTKWSPICSGNSIYKENSQTYNEQNLIIEELPIYRLDDCVKDIYDLIKIDTQGSELDIIEGGINTFKNAKVVIAEVSFNNYNEGGCNKDQILNKMFDLKFDYIMPVETVMNDKNELIAESLLFIRP
jgi:FkbM family methyltransferase